MIMDHNLHFCHSLNLQDITDCTGQWSLVTGPGSHVYPEDGGVLPWPRAPPGHTPGPDGAHRPAENLFYVN